MKKFVVERNLLGAGNLSPEELQAVSQTSCEVIERLGRPYQWIHSFITDDKIYCIHMAESEEVIRKHARLGKFPINAVTEVKAIIDPNTANSNREKNIYSAKDTGPRQVRKAHTTNTLSKN